MWQRLSKILNFIGSLKMPVISFKETPLFGSHMAMDAKNSGHWKNFMKARSLFDVWGPVKGSPWEVYHCVPLFAAMDSAKAKLSGPTREEDIKNFEGDEIHLNVKTITTPLGKPWADGSTWVILDLPGVKSVAAAVRFVAAGFQPVCTFDHWPHSKGLLKPENILAQLLRYASTLQDLKDRLNDQSPPLWICDSHRLGTRSGKPLEFDNRYFLDDSILPSAEVLKKHGIRKIICVVANPGNIPCIDLCAYFRDLIKDGFTGIRGAGFSDPALNPFEFSQEAMSINLRKLKNDYQRSDSGGFGKLIPEPSSSGG